MHDGSLVGHADTQAPEIYTTPRDAPKIDPVNLTEKKIRNYIAARDADGRYLDKSVKGALRVAMLEGVEAVAPTMAVQYGMNERTTVNNEHNAWLTAEGWVTFGLEYSVDTY